ncbi:uncharacterized protein SPPG_03579 [Spizellomyces punctatus DAOM BR117]|uniref:DUF3730 domain-containing protein n=1 Tax=Spizellomyces punctatus (strain DAOM BR117) TaxID=645134 RepID=A0A0L0HKZ1_SPIPD|nr:uncharacterized protein SPPG_03579 [Spizellomyces punctatus DAOM BR117]KND01787.1 hypothetical protein SPPG_03579 [Spizellomyces punctatus DAOM BR117]|eukprot:XP_016609826.1 hypothetical protein SPPG_03579 [Spizellomyces punctatus DAOM BR117]
MDIPEQRRKLQSGLRSVQRSAIQNIRDHLSRFPSALLKNNGDLVTLLWEVLTQAGTNAFLAAASGDAVVYLVRKGSIDWRYAMNELLGRLPTVPELALPFVVRAVSQLLLLHVESQANQDYQCPFGLRARRPHPFVSIVETRPEGWVDVLQQTRQMLNVMHSATDPRRTASVLPNIIRMLAPFVRYVCVKTALSPQEAGHYQGVVLEMLLNAAKNTRDASQVSIELLLSIFDSLPIIPGDISVVQAYLLEGLLTLMKEARNAEKTLFLYRLLQNILECRHLGRSVSWELSLLRLLVTEVGIDLSEQNVACVLIAALAYCLYDVPEYAEEGAELVGLMLHVVRSVEIDAASLQCVLRSATLPLLQTAAESSDAPTRRKAFDLLVILERSVLRKQPAEIAALRKTIELPAMPASGSFAVLLADLRLLLLSSTDESQMAPPKFKCLNAKLGILLCTSLVFHPMEQTRIAALSDIVSSATPFASSSMSILPLLLYALKNETSAKVQVHIVLSALPALVETNDVFVTAGVFRVAQSLLGDNPENATGTLASLGIRMILEIWKRQPRIWPQFKGHLIAYLRRRRYGRPMNWSSGGRWIDEVEIELAMAASMRDVCAMKAADCGQDLLPQLFSLLHSSDLHPSTISYAIQSINACIEADITDPRAAWNVFMNQFVDKLGDTGPVNVLVELCEFYRLVAVKDEATDTYMLFKPEILESHLYPFTKHAAQDVREAAFRALACFPTPDLFPLLGTPRDVVSAIVSQEEPPSTASEMLASLIRHECKHMRRAVFKGLAASAGARLGGALESGAQSQLEKVLRDVTATVRSTWEGGRAPTGLRSGLAAFALLSPQSDDATQPIRVGASLEKMPFYRSLADALRDLSLADHIVLRMQAVPAWTSFWESSLLYVYKQKLQRDQAETGVTMEGEQEKRMRVQQLESIVAMAASDLLQKRLRNSRLPSLSVNIILAFTGLVLAASSLGLVVAHEEATRGVDLLLKEYTVDPTAESTDAIELSDAQRNDDIQFAVALAMANMVKVLPPNDEKRTRAILELLVQGVNEEQRDGQGWHQFACAFGLPIAALSTITSSPSGGREELRRAASFILDKSLHANIRRSAMMGFATILQPLKDASDNSAADVGQIVSDAVDYLENSISIFERGIETEMALVEGSAWMASAAVAAGFTSPEQSDKIEDILREALQYMDGKRSLEGLYAHILLSYTRVIRARHAATSPDALAAQLSDLSQVTTNQSVFTSTRIANLLAIGPLLGIEWCSISFDSHDQHDVVALRRTIDTLRAQAVGQEFKVARIAGWVLGILCSQAGSEDEIRSSLMNAAGDTSLRTRDPPNYSRLHQGSSFLRAAYDTLAGMNAFKVTRQGFHVLLDAFINVDIDLPPVDWMQPFSHLTALDTRDQLENDEEGFAAACYLLAARQASATSAKSFVEYFVTKLTEMVGRDAGLLPSWEREALVSSDGICKLLKLGGLNESEDRVAGGSEAARSGPLPVAVASSKVLEIFKLALRAVFGGQHGTGFTDELQREFALSVVPFLSTSVDHQSGMISVLRSDLAKLVMGAYRDLPPDLCTPNEVATTRALVTCISVDIESIVELINELLPVVPYGVSRVWTRKSLWAVGRIVEMTAMHASNRPWLSEALEGISGQKAGAASLVQVMRESFSQQDDATRSFAVCAMLTAIQHIVHANEREEWMHWMVRLLDVMIMQCAAAAMDKTAGVCDAVEVTWAKGLAGIVRLSSGVGFDTSDSEKAEDDISDFIMNFHCGVWEVIESEMIASLPSLVLANTLPDSLRRQIIKRLIRLLECTGANSTVEGKHQANMKTAGITLSPHCRDEIRGVVLRLRNGGSGGSGKELVRDAWAEIWEDV